MPSRRSAWGWCRASPGGEGPAAGRGAMNRVGKILGAALILGGVVWAFAAFGDLAAAVPRWSAWLGPVAIAAGFPLLFLFGARHGQEVWEAGEWIEAGGTVRGVTSVEFGVRLRVRLTAVGHGALEYGGLHHRRAPARNGRAVEGSLGPGTGALERQKGGRDPVGCRRGLVAPQLRARPYCFS